MLLPKIIGGVASAISGIIINYVGYPAASFNSFQQDSGLAQLIATSRAHKTPIKIFDYSSVEMVRRLRPRPIRAWLARLWRPYNECILNKRMPGPAIVVQLFMIKAVNALVQRVQERKIAKDLITEIRDQRPLFIGAKLWMGDGYCGSMRILKRVHATLPELPIVVGGPVSNFAAREIMEDHPFISYVVRGEGDIAMNYLVEVLQGTRLVGTVPNLLYRYGKKIGENPRSFLSNIEMQKGVLPENYSELYFVHGHAAHMKTMIIDNSRGCDNGCPFCVIPVHQGRRHERSLSLIHI